jgi:hypothetical protein
MPTAATIKPAMAGERERHNALVNRLDRSTDERSVRTAEGQSDQHTSDRPGSGREQLKEAASGRLGWLLPGIHVLNLPVPPPRVVSARRRCSPAPSPLSPPSAGHHEAVVNGQLSHSGDFRLARHIGNAVLREDARGARLAKERRDSPRRIDAAVAAVMATTGPPP